MKKAIKNFKNMQIVSIVIMFIMAIVGGLLFKFDTLSQRNLSIIFGAMFIVDGLFALIKYLYDGINSKIYALDVIACVIGVILGAFLIINKTNITKSIGICFGIWMIAKGVFNGIHGIKFMNSKEEIYPLVLFMSALMLIMGVLSIINPFNTFMLITKLISLFMAVYGILQVLLCLLFRKRAEQVLKIYS